MLMTDIREPVWRKINRIRALVMLPDVRGYVISVLDQRLSDMTDEHAMGIGVLPLTETQRRLASARITAEHLDEPERFLARPEGIPDLDAIEWCLRPALPVRAGQISPPKSLPWNELLPDIVAGLSRSVCRIDLGFGDTEPFQL